jgi:hypothetical protein
MRKDINFACVHLPTSAITLNEIQIVPFSKMFLWAPDVIFIPKGR